MNIAYGYQIARENDEIVELTEHTGRAFSEAAQPGFYMVDTFPMRMSHNEPWTLFFNDQHMTVRHVPSFLPLTQFKTIATQTRELAYQSRTIPFRRVIHGIKGGIFKRCFVSDLLENVDVSEVTTTNNNQLASPANLSYAVLKSDMSMEEFEKREDVGLIKAIAGGIFGGKYRVNLVVGLFTDDFVSWYNHNNVRASNFLTCNDPLPFSATKSS